jgi:hypothetical protein
VRSGSATGPQVLGADLLLSSTSASLTGPGGGLQELHQDQGFMCESHRT